MSEPGDGTGGRLGRHRRRGDQRWGDNYTDPDARRIGLASREAAREDKRPYYTREPGEVYVIQAGEGAVKIGFTSGDVGKRLAVLQVGNAEELRVVLAFPGTTQQEAALHKRLQRFRIHGEWFIAEALDHILLPQREEPVWHT